MGVLGNLHRAYHFPAGRISRKADREIRAAIIGIPLILRRATPTIHVPSVPDAIECPRCHRAGLTRLETVIKGGQTERQYQCGGCGYSWSEHEPPKDPDRRTRQTQTRTVPRNDRRR